ncbi:BadF/BadG/BcrA/BcrD ATPase family protein [Microcella sp.]|uniref:BadF/BadG/BcrA/BcrD ATPase family protein n=1 Tax=Microcella sp. TaxID=1913979 RepID=UPI00256A0D60|nr:BadF/BadG/BcrA/BcrD ATPase family protein [Microcella sp.]MBX9471413.1 hypothetical protein [Microcella sp.]MBX9473103.1 hypothetical protein [Microcella sp.]
MADPERQIVVAIDSGGSTTRVACIDRHADVVGRAVGGAGSPEHSSTSEAAVRSTLAQALADAGRSTGDVVALVAGMAGLNVESDQKWATDHTHLAGLTKSRTHLNDSTIAHVGAFLGEPGVLVIAGTGSIMLGIDRHGRQHRNDQLHHYAGAARHIAYDVVHHLLVGDGADDELLPLALQHWKVASVDELRAAVEAPYEIETVKRSFGTFAPAITSRVDTSSLARNAVAALARRTAFGIRLVGAPLGTPVMWSGAGSLATDGAFIDAVERELARVHADYRHTPAAMSPLGGAILLALRSAGWETSGTVAALISAFSD